MKKFTVMASYPGALNSQYDEQLFKLAIYVVGGTGVSSGSGFSFPDSTRDHDWGVDTKEDAELLKKVLLQAKIPGLEVKVL